MRRNDLAYDVAHLLGLPIRHNKDKGLIIVNTIFKTIIDALKRGEQVRIMGLGLFYVRYRKPHFKDCRRMYQGQSLPLGRLFIPTKRVVAFKPSKSLYKGLPWPI